MPPERWAGFALVWLALTILTWDALRTARRSRAAVEAAKATAAAEESVAMAAAAGGSAPSVVVASASTSVEETPVSAPSAPTGR